VKAAVYRATGPATEVLEVRDVERPEPATGEVRVRVAVSGVNPTDWKSRSGATSRPIDGFQVPNQDGSGVIDAVGEGVDGRRVGERVWLWLAAGRKWGTAAEWCVVPSDQAVPLPRGTDFDFGASLGVPTLTAHRCLFADGPIEGAVVLVAGGAGAVGHFAIELAKRAGATVVATVSSAEKAELATKAGADLVVNYREPGVAAKIQSFATHVDRVVEVAIGANLALDLALSRPGTVISAYAADGPDPVLPVRACMTANVILRFILLYGVPRPALLQGVEDVSAALREGRLTPLPYHRFALESIAEAHDAVEGGAIGKVLVEIANIGGEHS
jgi:NADPH:quinone reductase